MLGIVDPFLRNPLFALALAGLASDLPAQDYFPDPIPLSGIEVTLVDVAELPDSQPGQPARVSVVTEDPSGRLFANDQRGPLYHIAPDSRVTEYLDLRDQPGLSVVSTSEASFQSFAFHPDYFREGTDGYGRFYTIHSDRNTNAVPDFDPGGGTSFHTLLLEWRTTDPGAGVFTASNPEAPYRELMRLKQPFGNHNAGLIAFNPAVPRSHPDHGNLYIAIGDGGSGGDPQENGEDAGNPFGAILRIDPLGTDSANGRYGIVQDNALAADGDPDTLAEIYCYGLRNPQRFGWNLVTGEAYIADIGQNAIEEINRAANGAHFGWDIREGSFSFEGADQTGLTGPVAEYDHTNTVSDPPTGIGNRAVTLGEGVRGAGLPELEGKLLLSDFPTGLVFLLDVENDPLEGGQDGLSELTFLDASGQPRRFLERINAARAARGLSSTSRADLRFSVNTPGRIYLSNKHDGVLRRIQPATTPFIAVSRGESGGAEIRFEGLLQRSTDLESWELVRPQPASPLEAGPEDLPAFFRTTRP